MEKTLHGPPGFDCTAVKEAVKSGCGISVLSQRAVRDAVECRRLKAVPIKDLTLERPFYLVQRKNYERLPIVKVFQDYLLRKAAEKKYGKVILNYFCIFF